MATETPTETSPGHLKADAAEPAGFTDPNYRPPPGRLGNLSVPQQHALDTLKKELQDEDKFSPERMDDATLLRFLRARKFDVARAKAMLLEAEQWRHKFGVEDIVRNFQFTEKEEVDKYYPAYYHKTDKEGRPIYVERLGKLDIKALYAATTPERQLKRLVLEYEKSLSYRLPACSAACGHPVETFCTIMDLKNVRLTNFFYVKEYIMSASSIGQNYYPETMGKFYIVNAPWAFSAVWNVIKGWLDEATVKKISIIGGVSELLQQAEAQNLPEDLGGTCQCAPGCSLSDAGPWSC